MDLIYMSQDLTELGILQHYTLDLDIANDKDFEIKTLDDETLLEGGYWWYIDGTEYGGRIDKVEHDTKAKTVIYTGRNWRGLLNSKIIEPSSGSAYAYAEGSVADSINVLLDALDFKDLFQVDEEITTIETPLYQFARYCTLYDGIVAMLEAINCKMRLKFDAVEKKCIISCGLIVDHSDYLNYISANSLNFKVSQRKCGVNHLVCLGRGDGEARAVIHLYTDENGALQPYEKTSNPISNSDYILDHSSIVLDGLEERADVYDYASAEITYNYVMLASCPFDWSTRYMDYYEIDGKKEDEELSSTRYKSVESVEEEIYTPLESQPADWSSNYANYYYQTSDGEWKAAGQAENETYVKLTSKPSDWETNSGSYYYYHFDGVKYEYLQVGSKTNYDYQLQTKQPSDWKVNYKNYYVLYQDQVETKISYQKLSGKKAPTYKASTYYQKSGSTYKLLTSKTAPKDWSTKWTNYYEKIGTTTGVVTGVSGFAKEYVSVKATSSGKAPTWQANKYYTRYSNSVAPDFRKVINGGEYYCRKVVNTTSPTWESDKYYSYEKREVAPPFAYGTYYQLYEDWYKVLCEGGIARLTELNKADKQTVTLDNMEAEIGDIVSGTDIITNLCITEPITNIIVKIKNNVLSLDYTIGG